MEHIASQWAYCDNVYYNYSDQNNQRKNLKANGLIPNSPFNYFDTSLKPNNNVFHYREKCKSRGNSNKIFFKNVKKNDQQQNNHFLRKKIDEKAIAGILRNLRNEILFESFNDEDVVRKYITQKMKTLLHHIQFRRNYHQHLKAFNHFIKKTTKWLRLMLDYMENQRSYSNEELSCRIKAKIKYKEENHTNEKLPNIFEQSETEDENEIRVNDNIFLDKEIKKFNDCKIYDKNTEAYDKIEPKNLIHLEQRLPDANNLASVTNCIPLLLKKTITPLRVTSKRKMKYISPLSFPDNISGTEIKQNVYKKPLENETDINEKYVLKPVDKKEIILQETRKKMKRLIVNSFVVTNFTGIDFDKLNGLKVEQGDKSDSVGDVVVLEEIKSEGSKNILGNDNSSIKKLTENSKLHKIDEKSLLGKSREKITDIIEEVGNKNEKKLVSKKFIVNNNDEKKLSNNNSRKSDSEEVIPGTEGFPKDLTKTSVVLKSLSSSSKNLNMNNNSKRNLKMEIEEHQNNYETKEHLNNCCAKKRRVTFQNWENDENSFRNNSEGILMKVYDDNIQKNMEKPENNVKKLRKKRFKHFSNKKNLKAAFKINPKCNLIKGDVASDDKKVSCSKIQSILPNKRKNIVTKKSNFCNNTESISGSLEASNENGNVTKYRSKLNMKASVLNIDSNNHEMSSENFQNGSKTSVCLKSVTKSSSSRIPVKQNCSKLNIKCKSDLASSPKFCKEIEMKANDQNTNTEDVKNNEVIKRAKLSETNIDKNISLSQNSVSNKCDNERLVETKSSFEKQTTDELLEITQTKEETKSVGNDENKSECGIQTSCLKNETSRKNKSSKLPVKQQKSRALSTDYYRINNHRPASKEIMNSTPTSQGKLNLKLKKRTKLNNEEESISQYWNDQNLPFQSENILQQFREFLCVRCSCKLDSLPDSLINDMFSYMDKIKSRQKKQKVRNKYIKRKSEKFNYTAHAENGGKEACIFPSAFCNVSKKHFRNNGNYYSKFFNHKKRNNKIWKPLEIAKKFSQIKIEKTNESLQTKSDSEIQLNYGSINRVCCSGTSVVLKCCSTQINISNESITFYSSDKDLSQHISNSEVTSFKNTIVDQKDGTNCKDCLLTDLQQTHSYIDVDVVKRCSTTSNFWYKLDMKDSFHVIPSLFDKKNQKSNESSCSYYSNSFENIFNWSENRVEIQPNLKLCMSKYNTSVAILNQNSCVILGEDNQLEKHNLTEKIVKIGSSKYENKSKFIHQNNPTLNQPNCVIKSTNSLESFPKIYKTSFSSEDIQNLLKKSSENISTFLANHNANELCQKMVKKEPNSISHHNNSLCCYHFDKCSVFLIEVANHTKEWSKWVRQIFSGIHEFTSFVKNIKQDDQYLKNIYQEEWENFTTMVDKMLGSWRQYSYEVKTVTDYIIKKCKKRNIKCCPKCLQEGIIGDISLMYEVTKKLTEAIKTADNWREWLDDIMKHATVLIAKYPTSGLEQQTFVEYSESTYINMMNTFSQIAMYIAEASKAIHKIEFLNHDKLNNE